MKAALRAFAMAIAAFAAWSSSASADRYPVRPVKVIVPFPAGGATDVITRAVGERVGTILGQPWVIENRPAASGAIGLNACATAAPDGYTFCLLTADQLTLMPHYNPD